MSANHLLLPLSLVLCATSPAALLAQDTATEPYTLQTITLHGESATGPIDGPFALESRTATKSDTPILETPRAISVVSSTEIAARGGAQTIGETLGYTPGVFSTPIATNRTNWTERLRGFSNYQSGYQDGLIDPTGMDRAQPQIEPFGAERVEVLKGPASVLYGQMSPGGMVNVVSKRPTFEPGGETMLQYGSYSRLQAGVDLNGVIGDGSSLGWRLVGMVQDANTMIDQVEDDRLYLAPSLTWRPDDATSLTILTHYRRATGAEGSQSVPPELIDQLPSDINIGDPNFDTYTQEQWAIGYEFSREITPNLTFTQNARYQRLDVSYRQLYIAFPTDDPTDTPSTYLRTPYLLDETLKQFAIDTRLTANFDTGAARHTLLAGVDYRHSKSVNGSDYLYGMGPAIDLLDPVYGLTFPDYPRAAASQEKISHTGIYLQDQVELGRWRLSAGLRHDSAKTSLDVEGTEWDTATDDSKVSWNAGVLYLMDNGLAPYASYATSFKPEPGQTWDKTPFEPSIGKQVEIGVKYQPTGSDTLLTFSAFDLRRTNVLTDDPDHQFESIQTGEVRMRGVEVEGRTKIGPVQAVMAYTYLDSEITEANDGTEGNRQFDTPRQLASIWLDYTFDEGALNGLTLGGGVRHWSGYWGDNGNAIWNKGQTLVDLAASYDFGARRPELAGVTLDLNVSNLADRRIEACTEWGCEFGDERVASATLRYKW
ncbi:TonB-dependent siderophore receptor [Paracoccus caeni]|uniref:TonB-dependent siderophore receptor n=1 Tax=Paracoccus caeni TaxID=657651 RepID=A0A934SF76_9RHOB|nr:TonB-dependent siderophore receptor [Paracoccus caeni]MBK4215891.1 TonB-dependent siderophore receptor [Paracoccus caeni]